MWPWPSRPVPRASAKVPLVRFKARFVGSLLALPLSVACSGKGTLPAPKAPPHAPLSEIPSCVEPKATQSNVMELASTRDWWRTAVFYEVFVRSLADSDGDGVGDFRGLTAKLDELNDGDPATDSDLGVSGLWLMPIHPSPSYHGYDVTDYRGVNPAYGTEADFKALLDAAHQRGMRVIIDFVLNHASSEHPWFVGAKASRRSATRDWFIWRDAPDPLLKRPWDGSPDIWHQTETGYYYGLFWSGMPDLNLANPQVEAEMLASMAHWLELGVDGFRVDAVRYLVETADGRNADTPETHAVLTRLSAALRAKYPDVLLVAEAWTDRAHIAPYRGDSGEEMQLAFGFESASALMTAAKDGLRVSVDRSLREIHDVFPDPGFIAPFLTNHDMPRVMRQLAESTAEAGARPAAAALFAWPGTPFIYYGEEIGMQGGPSGRDEDKRTPMRWDGTEGYGFTTGKPWHVAEEAPGVDVASQKSDSGSLWHLYRRLVALRRSQPALATGGLRVPPAPPGSRGLSAWLRTHPEGDVLFVANFHDAPSETARLQGICRSGTVLWAEGLSGEVRADRAGLEIPPLAGRGFAFIQLDE